MAVSEVAAVKAVVTVASDDFYTSHNLKTVVIRA